MDTRSVDLTPAIATALYVGLVTDTGRFQYSNTTAESLLLAAELIAAGTEVHEIFREVYDYTPDGRRDPFNSLLTTSELRPTMSDLRLTGVLYDPANRRSGATLRDVASNAQYKVSVGSTLGRMRVSVIRNKTVIFTIEEFGTTRQDSLVLGDSTKVRKP